MPGWCVISWTLFKFNILSTVILFVCIPQLKIWGLPMLGNDVECATPSPHLHKLSHIQKQCYLRLLYLDFKDFNHGICYAMKLAVVKIYPDMELLTQILPYSPVLIPNVLARYNQIAQGHSSTVISIQIQNGGWEQSWHGTLEIHFVLAPMFWHIIRINYSGPFINCHFRTNF